MNEPEPKCPRCNQLLQVDAPAGHCPTCLLQLALEAATVKTAILPGESSSSKQPSPAWTNATRIKYFGDYELIEEIARGGMGVIWKARQTSLNRVVAIKMILAGQLASEADVRRFHTEAESAANLQHPNIVAIHEIGEHEGQHYFSMDYVQGKNLAELALGGPLPAAQAATLVKTIAEAVHFAHQRGTLHRDLKPSNVLIDAEGQPRITDFGLAKQMSSDNGLTQTGAVLGTPAYMPPEQASGRNEEVGPASDVYSIGAMLYHLLTGKAPFAGETPVATLHKVMGEEPVSPSKLNPKTPPDLETICLKCMEKRPDRRYHSARELGEELGRFLSHEPILAKPASAMRKTWSWAQRNPWAIVGVAAIIGIALLGVAYGLWEQVKHLSWEKLPPGSARDFADRSRGVGSEIPGAVGYLVMFPLAIYARFLNGRRQRGLQVGNLHSAVLLIGGASYIVLGLWAETQLIRLHVWKQQFTWYTMLGLGLGMPFLFCWFGGIWLWQSIQTHQAHWSGGTQSEPEWLPRQPLHYHSGAFLAASLLNFAIFLGIAYLTTSFWQHEIWHGVEEGGLTRSIEELEPANASARMLFVLIAVIVSFGCWVFARRKVSHVPTPVRVFLIITYVGGVLASFALPSRTFVLLATLTGLLGGLVLVKVVRLRKAEPSEKLPSLDELFHWERKAFMVTLALVSSGLLLAAWPIFRGDPDIFVPFVLFNTFHSLVPAVILALRKTSGKIREFFWVMLVIFLSPCFTWAMVLALQRFPLDATFSALIVSMPGLLAGWLLVHFGKIRVKVS